MKPAPKPANDREALAKKPGEIFVFYHWADDAEDVSAVRP